MQLRAKILGIEAGNKKIVVLNREDAEELGIKSLARIKLSFKQKAITCIVNIAETIVEKGWIGIYKEVAKILGVKDNDSIEVKVAEYPNSLKYLKKKILGKRLNYFEIREIVKDVVEGNLTEIEIASFITALHSFGLSLDEITSLTLAMVDTGKKLDLKKKMIVDKHSIGGIPGDKTSLILVPIVAAAGLTIPKTSSRAITNAAGTADRAEVLMPVDLTLEEMKEVVEKANGCLVWGGKLDLAPADDIFIQIEYPLGIDPLMLPSIMAKKKAVGSKYLVIDIPTGRGSKIKTIGDANLLASEFLELSKKLFIKTNCAITYGEQPLGYTIGPALEAKEALEILMKRKNVIDTIDKATSLAGILFEMVGVGNKQTALEILNSGKAEVKLREIISLQGGNEEIKPEDIEIGNYGLDFYAEKDGVVLWIDNVSLINFARAAGAPKDKESGILLYKKIGERVKKDEKIFTVFAKSERKLDRVLKLEEKPFGIGERAEMLIQVVKEQILHKKTFMLER
jgi:AMP phosphorylase